MSEVSLSILPKSGLAELNENRRIEISYGYWGFHSVLPHGQKK